MFDDMTLYGEEVRWGEWENELGYRWRDYEFRNQDLCLTHLVHPRGGMEELVETRGPAKGGYWHVEALTVDWDEENRLSREGE